MTDQYTKLADELDATAGNNSDMYEHERDSCREAARILRAAAGADVAGLMDVADRYALAQADPAHWRSALESDLRLALAAREGRAKLSIGDYTLNRYDENSIWIESPIGEAGQFSEEKLSAVVRKFYDDNF